MRSSLKPLILWGCLLLVGGTLAQAQDEQPKDAGKPKSADKAKKEKGDKKEKGKDKGKNSDKEKKEKKKDGEKDPTGAPGTATPGRLSLPIQSGHDSKGLKIPYYDTAGNLQMVFNIGVASRIDPDHVGMQETQVETYNEEGEAEMTVNLPASVLDLNTRVLTAKTKTTIKRDDFVISGDAVEFNTVTKQGTLVGNVHMIIYNLNDETTSPPPEPTNK